MADFTFGHLIRVDDSVNDVHWSYGTKTTVTGATDLRGFERKVFLIGTSEGTYRIDADVKGVHTVFIKNLDDTNYVEVGLSSGNYDFRFGPGQHGLFGANPGYTPWSSGHNEIFLLANTASCQVDVYVHKGL